MELNNILVPSDFSEHAEQAAVHAMTLAAKFDAKITLFHVVTIYDDDPYNVDQTFPKIDDVYKHLESQADQYFRKTIENYLDEFRVEKVIQRGFSPYEEIFSYVEENDVDMIAMGTHGRKPLARFFLGSVTEKVVHHAPCPVLSTRITDQKIKKIEPYKRIVVPIDFSEQSKAALNLAKQLLFDKEKGQLELIHVIEDIVHPAYYSSEANSLFDFMPDIREKSEESIKKMAKEETQGLNANIVIEEGRISKRVLEYADSTQADLIVMGTHGLNALEQLFIGSVANQVIRKASCPVVTVK